MVLNPAPLHEHLPAAHPGAQQPAYATTRGRVRLRATDCFMKCRLALLLGPAVLLLATGCVNVQPWQRGALADPTMRPDRAPLAAEFAEHMWFSREAASGGGRGVSAGGCGCN